VPRDTQWASRVDGHPDRCPTEGGRALDRRDRCPTEGTRVPDGEQEWPDKGRDGCLTEGGVLGGDPKGDYISAAGPLFWALSSCAQLHLQEMRERGVLMSESGPLRGEFRKECSPLHCFYD
jgi:hypothetical protein